MDINGVVASISASTQTRTLDAIQLAVLRKAMDIQAQNALQLVQAATQTTASSSPELGSQVDVFA